MLQTGHSWFDDAVRDCTDVIIQQIQYERRYIRIGFAEMLVNELILTETVIPKLRRALEEDGGIGHLFPMQDLPFGTEEERTEIISKLFSGYLLLFAGERILAYCIAQFPGRQPEESANEVSVKGPRDGFVEELAVNVGLIRKRLRTVDFKVERYTVGTVNRNEIALLYVRTLTNPKWVEEAKRRIGNIHTRSVDGATQIEEMLSDRSVALFPLIDYAGRPDSAVDALLNGRVLFILEGSPLVYLAPVNLLALLKSPEDNYLPYYFVSLEKLLRIVSLFIAIFLPGFWVSVSAFNIDQIPFPLLSTIVISRVGLPISATIEMLLMLALFELFREAGVRLPRAVGQTVAVVGGIIVGDAAIRAGLSSPTMLVVSSITAVSSFTLVNQSLSGAVTVVRLFVLLFCMIFGMFGFFLSMLVVVMYLSALRSFGVPYLAPMAPITLKKLLITFLRLPSAATNKPYGPLKGRRSGGGRNGT